MTALRQMQQLIAQFAKFGQLGVNFGDLFQRDPLDLGTWPLCIIIKPDQVTALINRKAIAPRPPDKFQLGNIRPAVKPIA